MAELPRLNELADMDAAFRDYLHNDAMDPIMQKVLKDFEADLSGLCDTAWSDFKRILIKKNALKGNYAQTAKPTDGALKKGYAGKELPRSWQILLDCRSEARAYNHLASRGYSEVEFIPEAVGQRTPDFKAMSGNRLVLCEVKTINRSDDECNRSSNSSFQECYNYRHDKSINFDCCDNVSSCEEVRHGQPDLPQEFFNKLNSIINTAITQMNKYDSAGGAKKLVYIFLNFDDILSECLDRYEKQLADFKALNSQSDIEIIFDYFPAFYLASA